MFCPKEEFRSARTSNYQHYWVLFKLSHKTTLNMNWELFDKGHILKQLGQLKICDIIEDVCKVTRHRVLCTVLHSMPFGGQTEGMRKCFAPKSNFAVRGTSNYQHLRIRYGCWKCHFLKNFFCTHNLICTKKYEMTSFVAAILACFETVLINRACDD